MTTTIRTPRPSGPEFRANTTTASEQDNPTLAALDGGGFVVAWQGRDQTGGNGFDIYAQRYAADGTPTGGEFRVNATTANIQADPAVVALSDGGFAVSWIGWYQPGGADVDVYVRRFAADGTPAGSETRANATIANNQFDPAIGALAGGGFVVSWIGNNTANGLDRDVYAQRFAADGTAQGAEFRVNTTLSGMDAEPRVTGLADGSFVVSWLSGMAVNSLTGLHARRFASDGTPLGAEFRVDADNSRDESRYTVTGSADGGFAVLWTSHSYQTGENDVRIRRFAADGTPEGAEASLGIDVGSSSWRPATTPLADGGYLVSWPDYDRAGGYTTKAQRYAADGAAVDSTFLLDATAARNLELATLADGRLVAAWTKSADGTDVYARAFAVPPLASEARVAPSGPMRVEGDSRSTALTFTVSLDIPSGSAQTVGWRAAGHGAVPAGAGDFAGGALPSGTLSFAPGETSKTITVNIAGDAAAEPDESFAVLLENASAGLGIGAAGVAAGTIVNDDLPASRGTAGDDVFVLASGRAAYEGAAGRDALDLQRFGFRPFDAAAQADGRSLLASSDLSALLRDVEEVRFADGRLVFDAADPAARVARLYEAALDRLPDQGGLNFWIGAVQQGQSLSALASGFIGSGEFQARFGGASAGDGAFVDQLYQNVLGRAGEPGGRDFWVGSLNSGTGRADVLAAFSESAENKAGTAALVQGGIWDRSEAAAEVARLYDTVFGRLPDAAGLTFWKSALEGGTATLAQMADAFTGSAEFRAKYGGLDNWDFAEALYKNSLDRSPNYPEMVYWEDRLDSGVSRRDVVLGFSQSQEHVNLTAASIQSENPADFGILLA